MTGSAPPAGHLTGPSYGLAVALTVLACAVLFAPWSYPRESVSGLLGRWLTTECGWKHALARVGAPLVDAVVHTPLGIETCVEIAELEAQAREVIYGC